MRLLTVSMEYPPIGGGGAPVVQGLAMALTARGHEIDVVTARMSDLPAFERVNGHVVHRVRSYRRQRSQAGALELATYVPPALRKVGQLLHAKSYDLMHVHFAVPSGAVAYPAWRWTGVPYVLTLHGSDVPGYNPDRFDRVHGLIRPAWKRIVDGAAAVVSPTHYLAGLFHMHAPRVPVEVIPNGFDRPLADDPVHKESRILVVSRLFERKGVHHLLDAIRDLDTDWEIVVAGDGPERESLERRAAKIRPDVHFVGQLPHDEVLSLYRSSRIFVFPSLQENFPMVLLEAMWAGCAIITTTADGCVEVVGDAALRTTPADPPAIRAALDRLLASPELVCRLSHRAQQRVCEFAWPRIAARYEACFGEVLARR